MTAKPHVLVRHRLGDPGVVDCSHGVPTMRAAEDSLKPPDDEGPVCAGRERDPFPSTTVYVIATFVDPREKHFDPVTHEFVTGPVKSVVYYQFAGIRHPKLLAR
jgi:hypothetical protein